VEVGEGLRKWVKKMKAEQWEGLILKRMNAKYTEGARCSDIMKILRPVTFKAVCIGIVEGAGEMQGMVGALRLKVGNVEFTAGGMETVWRETFMDNPPIGQEFTVVCKEILKSGKPREPRLCIR
jgi:ATP-dependent DNA ligase